MDIKELKQSIENKTLGNELIIFIVSDNSFVAHQYINAISNQHNKEIEYVDDIVFESGLFGDVSNTISVLSVDSYKCNDYRLLNRTDTYIICKSFDSDNAELFKYNTVIVPKLEQWQIKDYAYSIAEGVDTSLIDELVEICKYDIYRIDNELSKISIFNKKMRKVLFEQFIDDNMFSDMSKYNMFNFSNAVVQKNYVMLAEIYKQIENIDCEPMGLLTTFTNNIKNIISIQLALNPTPESAGLKPNQFWAIKHSCGIYSKEQLVDIYTYLLDIDKQIKIGNMPMEHLVDLLVMKVLNS